MKPITYAKIATLVDNDLLSNLSESALVNISNELEQRRTPDSSTNFPGETFTMEDLDRLSTAVQAEIAIRPNFPS